MAAQAAGALGLVHVVQGRSAVRAQRVCCALAADASLQAMRAESGDSMLASGASLVIRAGCQVTTFCTALLHMLVCRSCMQNL